MKDVVVLLCLKIQTAFVLMLLKRRGGCGWRTVALSCVCIGCDPYTSGGLLDVIFFRMIAVQIFKCVRGDVIFVLLIFYWGGSGPMK